MNAVDIAMRALEAVSSLQTHGVFVDAIVMNPLDWQEILDDDDRRPLGDQFFGGRPRTPKTKLWNQPIILSDKVKQGRPMAATWGMGR